MIGPSIIIKGEVSGEENLAVQGRVEGTINLGEHELSVGESGKVFAEIHARVIRIDGEVTGDISGSEQVVVSRSGNVRGNIIAPRVSLEDGAIFKGSIDMDPGEPVAKPRPVDTPKAPESAPAPVEHTAQLDLKSGKG